MTDTNANADDIGTGADDVPYPIDYENPHDHDERAAKLLAVLHAVTDVIEAFEAAIEESPERTAEMFEQETLDKLQAAFQAGQRVLDAPEYEAFLQEGPDALDDDLRDTVAEDLAPLAAPVFGVDLDWPGAGADVDDVALEDLTTADGWRGS
jgi:hypothetical protein